jgi:hypothetical protein
MYYGCFTPQALLFTTDSDPFIGVLFTLLMTANLGNAHKDPTWNGSPPSDPKWNGSPPSDPKWNCSPPFDPKWNGSPSSIPSIYPSSLLTHKPINKPTINPTQSNLHSTQPASHLILQSTQPASLSI